MSELEPPAAKQARKVAAGIKDAIAKLNTMRAPFADLLDDLDEADIPYNEAYSHVVAVLLDQATQNLVTAVEVFGRLTSEPDGTDGMAVTLEIAGVLTDAGVDPGTASEYADKLRVGALVPADPQMKRAVVLRFLDHCGVPEASRDAVADRIHQIVLKQDREDIR